MTDTTSMPLYQPSLREQAGIQASAILRGPKSIHWDSGIEDEPPFYGWAMLSLKVTTATLPSRVESRSVYADLYDESQQSAVLRAVYWDWELAKTATHGKEEDFNQSFPARFVSLPLTQLRNWLFTFTNTSVIIGGPCEHNDKIPIRGLRIERDYTACIFEKVWQAEDTDHAPLNGQWNQIWQQMTEALTTELITSRLREKYWFMKSEVQYDFHTYQPNYFDFS